MESGSIGNNGLIEYLCDVYMLSGKAEDRIYRRMY